MKNKNKHWLKILLFMIAFFLIIGAIISLFTPQKTKISFKEAPLQNVDFSSSNFENIVFEGEFNPPTNEFEIYSYQSQHNDIQQLIALLKNKFQLEPSDYSENLYLGNEYTLSHSPVENSVALSLNQSSNTNAFVDRSLALDRTSEFLEQILPKNQYSLLNSQTKYYSNQGHLSPSSPLNATLIEFQFFYQFDDTPVFMANATEAPVKIMVNNQLQIQRAIIAPVELIFQPVGQRALISVQDAVDNINNHSLGALIKIAQEKIEPIALASIDSGVLKEVALEYRVDPTNNLIFPFYKFEGEFVNNKNEIFWAYLITPAVVVENWFVINLSLRLK